MKFTFTSFICLTFVAFLFTACQKGGLAPVPTTNGTPKLDSLASQVATGLIQSFNGKFGGININDGIKAPAKFAANHKGHVLFGTEPMCGSVIDTAFTTTVIAGDTTKFSSGKFNFVYTCSTDYLDGYKVTDNGEYKQTGTGFYSDYQFDDDLTVKALDKTYKLVSLSGSSHISNFNGPTAPENITARSGYTDSHQTYTFTSTQVDLSTATAYFKGEARFIIGATDIKGKYVRYTGMMFFGHTKILMNVEIPNTSNATNGETYEVNLLTGKVKFTGYF